MSEQSQSTRPTPHFDRLCILFLAFDWIFFGSMHFSFHEATVLQIPEFFPAKSTLVVITGVLEVATGMLILVPEARRWAALSSMVLLALLSPAVVNILANESALQGPFAWRALFRSLVLPNLIFMALCSFHLWRYPTAASAGFAESLDDMLARRRFFRKPDTISVESAGPSDDASARRWWSGTQGATLLVAFLFLAANCAGFIAIWASRIQDKQTACLWAMMCIALGAFVGFLFAVPRVNTHAAQSATLLPNTNIEAVSDWLTKIIVGVGLIHLKEIGGFLKTTSDDLAGSLGGSSSFALALILYFFVDGLLQGYLLTRMFLAWQFALQPANSGPAKDGKGSAADAA